jgi:hypothetical protein
MWIALLVLPAFWASTLFLQSSWSGWRTLSRAYPAKDRVEGRVYTWRSARMGLVFYRYCLRFVAGPDGLEVAVHLPFRPGHPPLFIPWRDLSAHATEEWFMGFVAFRLARHPEIRFLVAPELARDLLAQSGRAIPIEES